MGEHDIEQDTEDTTATPQKKPKKKPGRATLAVRIILFSILAVLTWRLVHDSRAVKQYEAAWDRVVALHQARNEAAGNVKTGPAQVREAIGHDSVTGGPVAVEHYYREEYVWQRGLPWMRYYICIIYKDVDGEPEFFTPFQGCEPGAKMLPVKKDAYGDQVEANIKADEEAQAKRRNQDDGGEQTAPDPGGSAAGDGPGGGT